MTGTNIILVSHSILQESGGNTSWDTFRFSPNDRRKHVRRTKSFKYYPQTGTQTKRHHIEWKGNIENASTTAADVARCAVQKSAFDIGSYAAATDTTYEQKVCNLIQLVGFLSLPSNSQFLLHRSMRSLQPVECLLNKICYPGDFFTTIPSLWLCCGDFSGEHYPFFFFSPSMHNWKCF